MGTSQDTFTHKARVAAKAVLRYFPRTRQWARKHWWDHERKQYEQLISPEPVDPKVVVFSCFMGRSYADSPRAIYEQMLQDPRFDDYELYWVFRESKIDAFRDDPRLARAHLVVRSTEEYQRVMGRAGYWIINNRCPEYMYPRPGQTYVQCWHGTPLKRLGYDVQVETTNALNTTLELARRFELDSSKWDYLISPSPFTSLHLSDAFGLPQERRGDVVLEVGYPRNDVVARACETPETLARAQARIKEALGVTTDKKLLLYAPTWRDNDYKAGVGYVQDTLIDFDLLQQELGDEWTILFRPHYYIANEFDFDKYGDFVYNAANVPDINELYIIADALLTDYSSVFFDYSVTNRPMLFYWPDYAYYDEHVRGFYFDPHEIPGPKCLTTPEVVQAVKDLDSWRDTYGADYQRFREYFLPKDDGHAAERAIECIFFGKKDSSAGAATSDRLSTSAEGGAPAESDGPAA